MHLVVGLGNPGLAYQWTRHNLGFMVIDALANRYGVEVATEVGHALIGRVRTTEPLIELILAKPQTYMNLSGMAVVELFDEFQVSAHELIVIYDDIDLDLGRLRIRKKGGPGSHRGMKSVIAALGATEFIRIRIGIGSPPEGSSPVDYVLSEFTDSERLTIMAAIDRAADAVEVITTEGVESAMNRYNSNRN